MLNTSTVVVLMVLNQPTGSGRPADWKAESLVVAVRKADEIVERANVTADSLRAKPERSPCDSDAEWAKKVKEAMERDLTQPYRDCVATLRQTLSSKSYLAAVKVVSAMPADDGSLLLTGVYDQRTKARTFYTAKEADKIRAWDEEKRRMDERYARAVERWQRHPGIGWDPARDWPRQLLDYETRREVALREIGEAAAEREARYRTVSLRCKIPAELAKSIDSRKLLSKKSVKLLVQITDVELQPPVPEANIPATVSLIIGNIVDLENFAQNAEKASTP